MIITEVLTLSKKDVYLKDKYLLSSSFVKWTVVSTMTLDFPTGGFSVGIERAQYNRKPGEKHLIGLSVKRRSHPATFYSLFTKTVVWKVESFLVSP